MSTPLQNRLVGTIIVAAVAIIFLPDIFDGEKKGYQDDFASIPQAPKFESTRELTQFPQNELDKLPQKVVLSEEQAVDNEDDLTVEDSQQVKPNIDNSTTKNKSSLTKKVKQTTAEPVKSPSISKKTLEKALPNEAWVVQLGSFRHKKNVSELVAKLKKHGYTAFTQPIKTKSGDLTKVFVGPELIKSTLEKKLPALKKLTNVDGKIARFYPTKQ